MEKYPLLIQVITEFEGSEILEYYSRGHHDKKEFIMAVSGDYGFEGDIEKVKHLYGKLTPLGDLGMVINYHKKQVKGSFPVTVIAI